MSNFLPVNARPQSPIGLTSASNEMASQVQKAPNTPPTTPKHVEETSVEETSVDMSNPDEVVGPVRSKSLVETATSAKGGGSDKKTKSTSKSRPKTEAQKDKDHADAELEQVTEPGHLGLNRFPYKLYDEKVGPGENIARKLSSVTDGGCLYHDWPLYNSFTAIGKSTKPPQNVILQDWHVAAILKSTISKAQRGKHWPADFQMKGTIQPLRKPRGRAAKMLYGGQLHYEVFFGTHQLSGDEGRQAITHIPDLIDSESQDENDETATAGQLCEIQVDFVPTPNELQHGTLIERLGQDGIRRPTLNKRNNWGPLKRNPVPPKIGKRGKSTSGKKKVTKKGAAVTSEDDEHEGEDEITVEDAAPAKATKTRASKATGAETTDLKAAEKRNSGRQVAASTSKVKKAESRATTEAIEGNDDGEAHDEVVKETKKQGATKEVVEKEPKSKRKRGPAAAPAARKARKTTKITSPAIVNEDVESEDEVNATSIQASTQQSLPIIVKATESVYQGGLFSRPSLLSDWTTLDRKKIIDMRQCIIASLKLLKTDLETAMSLSIPHDHAFELLKRTVTDVSWLKATAKVFAAKTSSAHAQPGVTMKDIERNLNYQLGKLIGDIEHALSGSSYSEAVMTLNSANAALSIVSENCDAMFAEYVAEFDRVQVEAKARLEAEAVAQAVTAAQTTTTTSTAVCNTAAHLKAQSDLTNTQNPETNNLPPDNNVAAGNADNEPHGDED